MRIICMYLSSIESLEQKKRNKNNVLNIEGACHLHMHSNLFFVPNNKIECLKMTIFNSGGSFTSFFHFFFI